MKKHDMNFGDRLERAAEARKLLLTRFAAKPAADDPTVLARAAERQAIKEARETRAVETAARQAAAEEQREAEAAERHQREDERQAEQKAQRDARYAARKARKG